MLILNPLVALALTAATPKIAINNFEASAGASPEAAKLLTLEFASSVRRRTTYSVITQDDLKNLLGFERQRQLLNCGDSRCLAEIGGALGVDFIVTGTIGNLGTTLLFSARTIDVRRAAVAKDFSRRLSNSRPEALLDAVDAAVTALFPEARPPVPAAVLEVVPNAHHGSGVAPWLVCGGGGAVAVTGAVLLGLAAGRANVHNGATTLTYGEANGVNTEGQVGQGLLVGGLVVAAAGAAWGLLAGAAQ